MNQPTIVDWVGAIGSIATPVLILLLGAIGWTIRLRFEKNGEREKYIRELEEKLRDDRMKVYNDILEPFIIIFMNEDGLSTEKRYKDKTPIDVASQIILSLAYKQAAFALSIKGSDNVVRAFNNLMQYFYSKQAGRTNSQDPKELMILFGDLLLEIRRSVGNGNTRLDNLEILEWLITDIRTFRT